MQSINSCLVVEHSTDPPQSGTVFIIIQGIVLPYATNQLVVLPDCCLLRD